MKFLRDTSSVRDNEFLIQFVKDLEPRFFHTQSGMIQDQYEEIFEVVFITKGSVGVGYRLFNEVFYGMRIIMSNKLKINVPINDYECIHNKCSEFLYKPIEDKIEALSMRRENFIRVMHKKKHNKQHIN